MWPCNRFCLAVVLVGAAGLSGAAENHLPGRVLRVIDGDSLILDVRGSQYRIELADIDAPELNQPWGQAAADWLHRSLTGSFVVLQRSGTRKENRIEGTLISRHRDIALDLLHAGLAWCTLGPVTEFPDHGRLCREAEAAARQARRGLWMDEHAIPPWVWRRQGRPGD